MAIVAVDNAVVPLNKCRFPSLAFFLDLQDCSIHQRLVQLFRIHSFLILIIILINFIHYYRLHFLFFCRTKVGSYWGCDWRLQNLNLNMMQRYERRTIQEELITAQAELAADYEELQQINYEQLTPTDSAGLLSAMISKLSSPVIGTQVLRTDLFRLEYPFLAQYEMILDKAEIYYYQSIAYDLARLQNSEPVVQISKEEIRQCVEELNWKINVQRSSYKTESQEVGENMDLMKFFEGVRNYQNWHENIKRDTLTHLKERAHAIENQLSFKRGFILSKFERQIAKIQADNLQEIFRINVRHNRFQRIVHILGKIRQGKIRQHFENVKTSSKNFTAKELSFSMFSRYLPRKFVGEIRRGAVELKVKKDQITKIVQKLTTITKKVQIVLMFAAMKKLNVRPMIKASKYTTAVKLMTHLCQKFYVRGMIKSFNIPTKAIFNRLNEIYFSKIRDGFTQLKNNDIEIRLERPNVSYRIKGKVLASLNKYEKEPINLKKTFSKWYLNTHEERYAKKVYNIWLQGNTNKFTFFMRLKNLANQMSKQEVSKELRNFVKVICEKYHKYEEHNKKHILSKWIENNRRLRKIEDMFKLLTTITNQSIETFKKQGIQKIAGHCKRKQVVKHYCNKYMLQYLENIKIALAKWKMINNIKKQWGKKKLRKILLSSTEQIIDSKRQALVIFKKNWIEGRQIKTRHTRNAINKDAVFLERFMQIWKRNVNNSDAQVRIANEKTAQNKKKSLISIQGIGKRSQIYFIRDIIHKFVNNRNLRLKRTNNLKHNFIRLIESNEQYLKRDIFDVFSHYLKEGKAKKEKLVNQLVHANVIKEKMALLIFRNKSLELTELLKRQKSVKIFDILEGKLKQNYLIFNKRLFIARVLQKIVNNHTQNVTSAFKSWKAMPLRIRWKLRSKVIAFQEKLVFLTNQRLAFCNNQLKSSLLAGKLKQKKAVYIMACKYEMVLKRYFHIYHHNAAIQKEDAKLVGVAKLFEAMNQREKSNFGIIYEAPAVWPKKEAHFIKLNEHLRKRFLDFLQSWRKNVKALKYFNEIKDEKKKRCLQLFAKVMNSVQNKKSKAAIEAFMKNALIRKRKAHILKKICDSQVMKVLKGFGVWKNLPVLQDKKKVEKAAKFQASLTGLVKRNLRLTVNQMKNCLKVGNDKKNQLVRDLVSGLSNQIQFLFNKWRENKNIRKVLDKQSKVQKMFKAIFDQARPNYQLLMLGSQAAKKRKCLDIIENYWTKQQKYRIKQWYKNTYNEKMKDVKKKHLLIGLINLKTKHSNNILYERAISKFVKNRDETQKDKKRAKAARISKMIDDFESQKRMTLNQTMDKLKFLHIKGNFHKNRAFHRFLREKITQVHKYLQIWNGLANQVKQVHKQKKITENFDHLFEALSKNYYTIFGRTKESSIKKNILDKLFRAIEIKYKGCFTMWRQKIKELKILGEMDKQTKAAILERISKIVQSTSTQAVVEAIRKFNFNYKVQKVQRKFIERLLNTKSGSVINAFNNWKTIPAAKMTVKYKNYQKFYFKLENFFKDRLKFVHSAFSEVSDDANLMKKQSILKLFEMTSLGIRRYYNRWTRLTKEKHILMTVNRALKAFESGESAIANQYLIMFQDERAYKLKIAAIDKIIIATRGTTQNYFNVWRSNVRQYNISQKMGKQDKKKALEMFNRVMGNSKTGQILNIISLFQKNAKVVKVAKAFFNRLMHTKAGKVLGFFQKLKTIPDAKLNKLKKRGIVFESRLHHFVLRRMRQTLLPFKENTYTASIKKKYCLDRLLRACMGENKKKFLLWRNINREAKMLAHTSLFQKIFSNSQEAYRQNYQLLTKDAATEMQKKKNLCRKLINNSLFVQHHAYMIWKEAYHVDDINTKKRQNHYTVHLKNLASIFQTHQNKRIVQIVGVFRRLLELRNFQEFDYYKNYKNRKCVSFYENLRRMQSNNKFSFIHALKSNQSQYVLAEKSQKLLDVFQTIQHVSKMNMTPLLRTQDKTALLNKTFNTLCNNKMMNVSRIFNIWRENKNVKDIQIVIKKEKKKQALKNLNTLLIQMKTKKTVEAVQKFALNLKVCNIKKRLFLKFIKNKSDKVPASFNVWKNIPYQQAKKLKNKATKFQQGLLNLRRTYLKEVNDCFKKCHLEGIIKKEQAARRVVRSKLLDTNRLFFQWRKINNENKITEKIITLDRTFTNIEQAFHDKLYIFDDCKIQDQRKIRAATLLFNNNVKRLNQYFDNWRRNARILKLHQFQRLMRNFNPQDFNNRLMRIGFLMIEKRQQMQVLKGYINSLWKWKLSNIQASYYTKFINVFKESEELIKLSNLINKKLYENRHHGFRSILAVGHSRTNRKREIVQKYLSRKARNYFLVFKNNTLKSEINIWKSKYTESIKSKILSDVLGSIFLKRKSFGFNSLTSYNNYTYKIQAFNNAFEKCNHANVKSSFYSIKWDAHFKLLDISDRLFCRLRESQLFDAFNTINNNRRLQKLTTSITKIVEKHHYAEGFARINRRKERIIKSRLSIILLQTLIKQHVSEQIKFCINQFNKNRVKRIGVQKMFKFMSSRYEQQAKRLIDNCNNLQNIAKLLQRFKRAQKLQKILEKQDEQLKKAYLNKMRKKQNKWMELAIKKFATRASIRSSPAAITLWRLKTFALNA